MHPTRWELSHMVDLQAAANSLVILIRLTIGQAVVKRRVRGNPISCFRKKKLKD
uniref:Allatotropin neuropeptide n=1 Tax=Spodoptera frugiperda TaxID=7108 RepID=Q6KEQ0_SPOFR|nr:allatotropin neuropeptide precursor [Spodoptera frugiperda]